jgi:hypothetical protein
MACGNGHWCTKAYPYRKPLPTTGAACKLTESEGGGEDQVGTVCRRKQQGGVITSHHRHTVGGSADLAKPKLRCATAVRKTMEQLPQVCATNRPSTSCITASRISDLLLGYLQNQTLSGSMPKLQWMLASSHHPPLSRKSDADTASRLHFSECALAPHVRPKKHIDNCFTAAVG